MKRILEKIQQRLSGKDKNSYYIDVYRKRGMQIGENCKIYSELKSNEPYLIRIGNNVTISGDVLLLTHDNSVIKVCNDKSLVVGKIEIEDNCFIGARATILPGCYLAKGTIVGAGSVVVKSVFEENQIIAGNPAKVISNHEKYVAKHYSQAIYTDDMTFEEKKNYILCEQHYVEKVGNSEQK